MSLWAYFFASPQFGVADVESLLSNYSMAALYRGGRTSLLIPLSTLDSSFHLNVDPFAEDFPQQYGNLL